MGRTAQDFETHGLQSMRKYLRSFTLPEPPLCSYHDMINLPPVTAKSKSHQNQALHVQPEDYRNLENMRPIAQTNERLLSCTQFLFWKGSKSLTYIIFVYAGLNANILSEPPSDGEDGKKNILYILPDKLSERFFTQRMSDISQWDYYSDLSFEKTMLNRPQFGSLGWSHG